MAQARAVLAAWRRDYKTIRPRMGQAMIGLYCASFRQVPRRIILDIADTFDTVHGGERLRILSAFYHEYGFQPIVVFHGEGRPVTALLRPARRLTGREVRGFLRRLIRAIRGHWPRVDILLRGDSHCCAPEVLDFCSAERLDFILGIATTAHAYRRPTWLCCRRAAGVHIGRSITGVATRWNHDRYRPSRPGIFIRKAFRHRR